ncbi:Threonylcarbamoyl-AMP synthase [Nosema granulosis]|uniref:Threonylcarbamoyl-AMP synthase n=1 Tax=Nosema granulosis TaxID=83296 RepID=A0A9P6L091_9MICR|nr:Threonylcarbamoyl-AMP synthase [Nosema granulosis]
MQIIKSEDVVIEDVLPYFENEVVVIPTETVYGLAANIYNEEALKNIFTLKGRPNDNPLIVHISSLKMLQSLIEGEIPVEYRKLIEKFWPGPMSLLFKAKSTISRIVTGGLDTVVVRMPNNKLILDILEKLGKPLAAPSANLSGSPSPSSVQHVVDDFGSRINLYIDGGDCEVGLESTVFSILNDEPAILRPGGITKEQITSCIKRELVSNYLVDENKILMKVKTSNQDKLRLDVCKDKDSIMSPGQKYKHYSPTNKFILFISDRKDITENIKSYLKGKEDIKIGIMKHRNTFYNSNELKNLTIFDLGTTKKQICANVFKGLRFLDKQCDVIFTCSVDPRDEGSAIMDRLQKAANDIYILE